MDNNFIFNVERNKFLVILYITNHTHIIINFNVIFLLYTFI